MGRRIVQMSRPYGRRILRIVDEHQYLSETNRWVRPGTYTGGEVLALSPSYEDVQYAINQAQPGDIVRVPAGFATWGYRLIINKPLRLLGAGMGNTRILNAYVSTNTSADSPYSGLIYYNPGVPDASHIFELSGFELDMDAKAAVLFATHGFNVGNEVARNVRVHHNKVKNTTGASNAGGMFRFHRHYVACVDSNIGESVGVLGSNFGGNYRTWTYLTFDPGSGEAVCFEDNVISGDLWYLVGSTGAGARTYVRYNTAHSLTTRYVGFFDIHGNQTPPYTNHAGLGSEIYENVWHAGAASGGRFGDFRAGRNMVFNNRILKDGSAFQSGPSIREEYNDSTTVDPKYNLISGQPQHISDTYVWNNLLNSTRKNPYVTGSLDYADPNSAYYYEPFAYKGVVPREDVHFWKQVDSFNGSTGMGVGLRSARPTSCTLEGAGYWATDEGRLYRWKSGAWELYYTPYTYPHPYRSHPILGD